MPNGTKMDSEQFINYVVDNPSLIDWLSDDDIETLSTLVSTEARCPR